MDTDTEIKQQVREFYDRVGWQEQSDGFYQNASYEDLRPVSQEYIHKCHLRVLRHLKPAGRFLLDAGSGPIQYPEYLEYSKGYQYRVCADISMVALQEARKRIGSHGLYVVCDVACLPFKNNCFDGEVSLHTLHHLPLDQQVRAYQELHRTLAAAGKAVVVNGWSHPPLSVFLDFWIGLIDQLYAMMRGKPGVSSTGSPQPNSAPEPGSRGTYVHKENAGWLLKDVGSQLPIQIWCWRSVSVRFLRSLIHEHLAGKFILRIIYWKEELFPHFLGKYGQYPLVELWKTQ
ncbi:MAG TPA: class I SAM-dependent methyltransferase [Anaerolineales bacterium]|nr:class I SAM-dependent methyltransferase [Anaerolineales bacterium]